MNWSRLARLPLLLWILCLALPTLPGWAQNPASPVNPVEWSAKLEPSSLRAGEAGRILLRAKINGNWHIYAPTTPPGGPIPTKITITANALLAQVGKIAQPKPLRKKDEGFGIFIETYSPGVTFGIPIKLKTGAKSGTVQVHVHFQVCNERLCLPPKDVDVPVTVKVEVGARRAGYATPNTSVPPQSGALSAAAASTASNSPQGASPTTATAALSTTNSKTTRPNLLAFLAAAFGAGLLSVLTPCVFPMVPITVSLFAKRGENEGGNRLAGPLAYCAGIIGTFTLLGVAVSALFGAAGLSMFAANPYVNLGLALLFIVLALNLFGVFEVIVPYAIMQRVQPQGKSGLLAPLLMGFAFTLTSFTCTVPFVGTALVTAATAGAFYPALGMLTFSTAFSLPFFLLALFPSYLSKLPRAGEWLVSVKAFMGFLELAAALKFLQTADYVQGLGLITRPVFLSIWFAIAVVAGLYLLRWIRLPKESSTLAPGPGRRALGVAMFGVALVLLGANNGASLGDFNAYLPPRDYGTKGTTVLAQAGEKTAWLKNDYEGALAKAKAENKPLLINFTGYACTNCRLMENNVLPHPDVTRELGDFVPVELFTDGTDAKSHRFNSFQQQKFGTIAIPLYAVVTPEGDIKGKLEGLERDPEKFAAFLRLSRTQNAG